MECFDTIVTKHQRSVQGYAVWYQENHPAVESYADYITLCACHCIEHCAFLAPSTTWEVVGFQG
jgi:hypothetical protein